MKAQYRVTEPDTEDWGWYINVEGADASYLVGASAEAADPTLTVEWLVHVHKNRSMKDSFLVETRWRPMTRSPRSLKKSCGAISRIEQVSVTRNV